MSRRLFIFLILILSTFASLAQPSGCQFLNIQLLDQQSKEPIPYAHILSNEKLITLSDYAGYFKILMSRTPKMLTVSSVGYETQQVDTSTLQIEKINKIYIKPDTRELSEVTITPTSLKDLIAEIYYLIPEKYVGQDHTLEGRYQEFYQDTTNNILAYMQSDLIVAKNSYHKKSQRGEVKTTNIKRELVDTLVTKYIIYAGPHIPHRFDFVMQRMDFINPEKFGKYEFTFLKEIHHEGRKLDVIGFEPSKGSWGLNYRGIMYIDSEEKIFYKAEFEYTSHGFMSNPHSRWAKRRKFITQYKKDELGWYLYYTWDEAVSRTKNFKLNQEYYTESISSDHIVNWDYREKFHYKEALLIKNEAPDSLPTYSAINMAVYYQIIQSNKLLRIASKFEVGYGLRMLSVRNTSLSATTDFDFQNSTHNSTSSFKAFSFEPAFAFDMYYRLGKGFSVGLVQFANFRKKWKIEGTEIGVRKRFKFKTRRPTYLNLGVNYQSTKNAFSFDRVEGYTPKYEKSYRAWNGSITYDLELNTKWLVSIGYNYAQEISHSDEFFLERKHGFLNLKKDHVHYDLQDVDIEIDGMPSVTLPDVFVNSSFDIEFKWAIGW